MTYLTLNDIKKHLNLDTAFTDDDAYLEALGTAAEEVVSRQIDEPLSLLEDDNHKIPQPLIFAALIWCATMYAVRESATTTSMTPVPHSFAMLCDMYRNYSYEKSNYNNNRRT